MKIYRVEHIIDGKGPYNTDATYISYSDIHIHVSRGGWDDDRHPTCVMDGIRGFTQLTHNFGFVSMYALFQWFSPQELTTLKEHGFVVVSLEVDDDTAQIGYSGQVRYDRHTATNKKRLTSAVRGW